MKNGRQLVLTLALMQLVMLIPSAEGAIVFEHRFGQGPPSGTLEKPYDVVVDTGGDIFVVDNFTHRIEKYDSEKRFVMHIGKPLGADGTHDLDGQLYYPEAIATDPSGSLLYVADHSNSRVQVFSTTDGAFVRKFGELGVGDGQLNHPGGIDVDAEGNVYVADTRSHRVQKFSSTGTFLDSFGSTATEEGELDVPVGIVVNDALGRVYVTDEATPGSIVEFTVDGGFVGERGLEGQPGQPGTGSILDFPDEITVDEAKGIIYVIEAGGMEVSMFDAAKSGSESFIAEFTGTDNPFETGPGYGFSPHGIFFNPDDGDLFVAASEAEGSQIFAYNTRAVPKLDVLPEYNAHLAIQRQRLNFAVRHDAMIGSCNVKATGTLKTPQSDPIFEGDTFDLKGPLGVVQAKRKLNYKVPLSDREVNAIRKARVIIKLTFRSPGGCNGGADQPEPVTERDFL